MRLTIAFLVTMAALVISNPTPHSHHPETGSIYKREPQDDRRDGIPWKKRSPQDDRRDGIPW
jgi:hypothetical protein